MPLARIISRTPQCWQALAVDLLGRGYAVEIVSPDDIPDNFADLELRVDTDALNGLTASITARDGGHSSSLDFVHHLRSPMEDFIRRPPNTDHVPAHSNNPVNLNAEPKLSDEIELPQEASVPPPVPVVGKPPVASSLCDAEIIRVPDVQEVAPIIPPPEVVSPLAPEPKQQPKAGVTIVFHRSQLKSQLKEKIKSKVFKKSRGWFLRTSAGFVAVVALGIVLVRGIRGNDVLVENVSADAPNVVSVDQTGSPVASDPQHAAAAAENSTAGLHQRNRPVHQTPKKTRSASAKSKRKTDIRKANNLPAEEAAVYRDKPAAKAVSRARRDRRNRERDDMVAEDTVIYLDKKVAPKNRLR
jgi:hypothetical protein